MKIAGVQMDVALGQGKANLQRMLDHLQTTTAAGAQLTVFPECALCGYCFANLDEARPHAESIPGPATDAFVEVCRRTESHAVFGLLESDGPRVFNAAVLIGPDGIVGSYRKVHLPYLGVDMFTDYGDRPFAVQAAGEARIGMNICYDSAFPEAARALALAGADLIVLPTNFPTGAARFAGCAINCRAMENAVYYMAVNRVGTERGFRFIGTSRICDPAGEDLAVGDADNEQILYAEIDPATARNKHIIRVPGKHEIDRLADRRPEMYGPLIEKHDLRSPGR